MDLGEFRLKKKLSDWAPTVGEHCSHGQRHSSVSPVPVTVTFSDDVPEAPVDPWEPEPPCLPLVNWIKKGGEKETERGGNKLITSGDS